MLIRYRINARYFYPRSPCGERPKYRRIPLRRNAFLSTLSLRRATQVQSLKIAPLGISIHALLAESDPGQNLVYGISLIFLSTLSLRRATNSRADNVKRHENFYPRSPCGERLTGGLSCDDRRRFLSTLSLRRATPIPRITKSIFKFLSTLSLRRATKVAVVVPSSSLYFYPRSPCGERPPYYNLIIHRPKNFYPRSPCGERHIDQKKNQPGKSFLSTLSLRRATPEGPAKLPKRIGFLSTLSLRRATIEHLLII